MDRYDKTSECLAVRILNIKNIPRNNKDVSIWKRLTVALIPQSPITEHMNKKSNLIPVDWNDLQNLPFHLFVSRREK